MENLLIAINVSDCDLVDEELGILEPIPKLVPIGVELPVELQAGQRAGVDVSYGDVNINAVRVVLLRLAAK